MEALRNVAGIQHIAAIQISPTEFCLPIIIVSPQEILVKCLHVDHYPKHREYPAYTAVCLSGLGINTNAIKKLHILKSHKHPNATKTNCHTLRGLNALQQFWQHNIEAGNAIYSISPFHDIPLRLCNKPHCTIGCDIPDDLIEVTLTLYPSTLHEPLINDDNIIKECQRSLFCFEQMTI